MHNSLHISKLFNASKDEKSPICQHKVILTLIVVYCNYVQSYIAASHRKYVDDDVVDGAGVKRTGCQGVVNNMKMLQTFCTVKVVVVFSYCLNITHAVLDTVLKVSDIKYRRVCLIKHRRHQKVLTI